MAQISQEGTNRIESLCQKCHLPKIQDGRGRHFGVHPAAISTPWMDAKADSAAQIIGYRHLVGIGSKFVRTTFFQV